MLSELRIAGWDIDYGANGVTLTDDDCINMSFSHPEMLNISLSVHICLDEIPVTVIVSLLDADGAIDSEWQDEEIDIDEITREARELSLADAEED